MSRVVVMRESGGQGSYLGRSHGKSYASLRQVAAIKTK